MRLPSNPRILAVIALFIFQMAILIALAMEHDLGFYAPRKGEVVEGERLNIQNRKPRDTVEIVITEQMTGEDGVTSLQELFKFFALEASTWPCSVAKTETLLFKDEQTSANTKRYLEKPRKVGEQVTLCL